MMTVMQKPFTIATLCALASMAMPTLADNQHAWDGPDPIPAEDIPPAPVLSPRDAYQTFEVAEGFELDPVAWEPNLDKPVAMAWDLAGRLWVVEMIGYMMDLDGDGEAEANGRIRILQDSNGDGRMDSVKTFVDDLVLPRTIAFAYEGVLYSDGDKLIFTAVQNDKPHGTPVVVDPTYAEGPNPQYAANSLTLGLDGWYYSANSDRRYRRINGEWVTEQTHQRGQWGLTMDNFGRLYHNTHAVVAIGERMPPAFLWSHPGYSPENVNITHPIGNNRVHPVRITPGVNHGYRQGQPGLNSGVLDGNGKLSHATAISGIALYRDDLFPGRYRNALFVPEPAGNLVKAVSVQHDNDRISGHDVVEGTEFLTSTDERFRPVNAYMGPDGCVYILDMYFGAIQHTSELTPYLRNQYEMRGLDQPPRGHGRLYRMRPKNVAPRAVPELIGQSTPHLIALLEHRNGWVRDQAQRILVQGQRGNIAAAVLRQYENSRTPYAHIHSLWTLQNRGELTPEFIKVGLNFPDQEVVATALQMIPELEQEKRPQLLDSLPNTNASDFTAPYKAKALASMGTVPAWQQLMELIEDANQRPFIEEAILAGIHGHEIDFNIFLSAQLEVDNLVTAMQEHISTQGDDDIDNEGE